METPFTQKEKRQPAERATPLSVGLFDIPNAGQHPFHLVSHFVNPLTNKDEPAEKAWVSPFWAVAAATESDVPNMRQEFHEVKVCNFRVQVPRLVNSRDLKAGEALIRPSEWISCPVEPVAAAKANPKSAPKPKESAKGTGSGAKRARASE